MVEYSVREMRREDFRNGVLETLRVLVPVNLTPEKAERIYDETSKNPVYKFLVAEEKETGKIIGTTTLLTEQKFTYDGAKAGHIEEVCTRNGYEGQGVGSALVKTALEEARKQGCYKVVLDCSKDLIPFYEKLGFKNDGTEMKIKF